jgi:hypothetical protein
MDMITSIILSIEGAVFLTLIVITVFLIVRRVRIKKDENFEKRDN